MIKKKDWILVLNPARPAKKETLELIRASAKKHRKLLGEIRLKELEIHKRVHPEELLIVAGGDATIMRGARLVRGTALPILAINTGHLGFHASCHENDRDDLGALLDLCAARQQKLSRRTTLRVESGHRDHWAINDCWLERDGIYALDVRALIDETAVADYRADAVIICTATGSTAYNFSAGGPIMDPESKNLLITPVAAMSLCQRSLIVEPDKVLRLKLNPGSGTARIMIDGIQLGTLQAGEDIRIHINPTKVIMVPPLHESSWSRITQKLGWFKPTPTDTR